MMNLFFIGSCIISFLCALITGNGQNLSMGIIQGAKNGIEIVISLAGIMCLWSGIAEIGENSGLCGKISKVMAPVLKPLFNDVKNEETMSAVAMNICANLLGMGNAATPLGIKAATLLDRENGHKKRASDSMCMLVVLNTASIQLIPSTLLGLMAEYNCENPFRIIPYVWLCSAISLVFGIGTAKVCEKF